MNPSRVQSAGPSVNPYQFHGTPPLAAEQLDQLNRIIEKSKAAQKQEARRRGGKSRRYGRRSNKSQSTQPQSQPPAQVATVSHEPRNAVVPATPFGSGAAGTPMITRLSEVAKRKPLSNSRKQQRRSRGASRANPNSASLQETSPIQPRQATPLSPTNCWRKKSLSISPEAVVMRNRRGSMASAASAESAAMSVPSQQPSSPNAPPTTCPKQANSPTAESQQLLSDTAIFASNLWLFESTEDSFSSPPRVERQTDASGMSDCSEPFEQSALPASSAEALESTECPEFSISDCSSQFNDCASSDDAPADDAAEFHPSPTQHGSESGITGMFNQSMQLCIPANFFCDGAAPSPSRSLTSLTPRRPTWLTAASPDDVPVDVSSDLCMKDVLAPPPVSRLHILSPFHAAASADAAAELADTRAAESVARPWRSIALRSQGP